jgi:hypothetical protein
MQSTVGAGLLANAVGQIGIRRLTQRVRQQAGSYRLISTQPQNHPRGTGFSREGVSRRTANPGLKTRYPTTPPQRGYVVFLLNQN